MTTRVVNVSKTADYDVYVGRASHRARLKGSIWGNPFVIGADGTREEVIAKYEEYLRTRRPDLARMARQMLTGQVLACWCKPSDCHGDVLVKICEMSDEEFERWLNGRE